MERSRYFDPTGRPIATEQWSELPEGKQSAEIARDDLPGRVSVSTAWLGMDHALHGRPMIFETQVSGGPHDGVMLRYSTEAEAMDGHRLVVAALLSGRSPKAG